MRTIRGRVRIPAHRLSVALRTVTCGALLATAVAACGSDEEAADTTDVQPGVTAATVSPAITVTVGVDAGPDRVEFIPLGATVTLTLINPTSDDEFHAHGYDLGDGMEIPAGEPATFTFVADQAGEFEVESHATDEVLVVLNVS